MPPSQQEQLAYEENPVAIPISLDDTDAQLNNWETLSLPLPEDSTVCGHHFKKGTELFFARGGRLTSAVLSENTTLQRSLFPSGSIVHFYKDGGVEWASLGSETKIVSQDIQIPNLPIAKFVSFYGNHNVKEATLSKHIEFQGYQFAAETTIHLSKHGTLVWAQLSSQSWLPIGRQALPIAEQTCVTFHHNGSIHSMTLARAVKIYGYRFDRDSRLHFDGDGFLAIAEVLNQRVRFNRNGSIREISEIA